MVCINTLVYIYKKLLDAMIKWLMIIQLEVLFGWTLIESLSKWTFYPQWLLKYNFIYLSNWFWEVWTISSSCELALSIISHLRSVRDQFFA